MKNFIILLSIISLFACNSTQQETKPNEEIVEYAKLTPNKFRTRIAEAPIAYLPLGTLEWHSEHLPLGADGLQSFEFMKVLAKEAGGIVLPMLYLGPDTLIMKDGKELHGVDHIISIPKTKEYFPAQQLDGSCYRVSNDLFDQIVENSVKLLARAGFKIIVAHGHGPSTVRVINNWQEWEEKYNVKIYTCWSWNVRGEYDKEGDKKSQEEGIGIMTDHAAQNETSLLMYFYLELVEMDKLPADTAVWPVGVYGVDPRTSESTELGQKSVEYHVKRLKDLLQADLKNLK